MGERAFDVEFLRLKPGAYRYTLRSIADVVAANRPMIATGVFTVSGDTHRCTLVLPSRVACEFSVVPAGTAF